MLRSSFNECYVKPLTYKCLIFYKIYEILRNCTVFYDRTELEIPALHNGDMN